MVVSRQLERLFDLRTIRRNIRSGLLTKERYEEYLRSLPDMTENITPLGSIDDDETRARRDAVSSPTFRKLDLGPRKDLDLDDDDDDDDDDDLEDDDDNDNDNDSDGAADTADEG